MTIAGNISTCRMCKQPIWSYESAVKYSVRHYAHPRCYLEAGKTLDELPAWKVKEFPYLLLKEYDLLNHPKLKEKTL